VVSWLVSIGQPAARGGVVVAERIADGTLALYDESRATTW
jgi:hypothetical protein